MYAFNASLRQGWTEIFEHAIPLLPTPYSQGLEILFDDDLDMLLSPELFIGHTCGYPYIENWRRSHDLICVPNFEIDGCQGSQYSSWFVTDRSSKIQKIEDCRNKIAVINHADSNSGMNVLRYEVSKMAQGQPFFDKVLVSGSHVASMEKLVAGEADLAAIDAVTHYFVRAAGIIDTSKLKIIGQSQFTTGLPFIKPKALQINPSHIINALNKALSLIPNRTKRQMQIANFTPMTPADYESIHGLKTDSENNGYPSLC